MLRSKSRNDWIWALLWVKLRQIAESPRNRLPRPPMKDWGSAHWRGFQFWAIVLENDRQSTSAALWFRGRIRGHRLFDTPHLGNSWSQIEKTASSFAWEDSTEDHQSLRPFAILDAANSRARLCGRLSQWPQTLAALPTKVLLAAQRRFVQWLRCWEESLADAKRYAVWVGTSKQLKWKAWDFNKTSRLQIWIEHWRSIGHRMPNDWSGLRKKLPTTNNFICWYHNASTILKRTLTGNLRSKHCCLRIPPAVETKFQQIGLLAAGWSL